jgi:hypothetical protein
MKGRKTKIAEQQSLLLENLRKRFPDQLQLIQEFVHERGLHPGSEVWLGLTETGIVRMFEKFVAPPTFTLSAQGSEIISDASILLSVSNDLRFLASKLGEGGKHEELQRHLKNEIIGKLEAMNLKWINNCLNLEK